MTGAWTKTGVTWNNALSNATQPTSMIDPGPTANIWIDWGVTQDVQVCAQGTPNHGWLLMFPGESIPAMEQSVQSGSKE